MQIERQPRNQYSFYSHKFKRAGFAYEIDVCCKTGKMLWVHCPFPCGLFPDLIFRLALKVVASTNEKAIADTGYRD